MVVSELVLSYKALKAKIKGVIVSVATVIDYATRSTIITSPIAGHSCDAINSEW